MSGVTEAVPVAKCLPGIVQVMQKLPLRLVRVINPLMGSFFDYSKVSTCHLPIMAFFVSLHTVITDIAVVLTEERTTAHQRPSGGYQPPTP